MQIWEGVTLAMDQLRSEKLKTFFSLLGVIMGVVFLIVVVTVVEGLDRYVREEVTSQVFGINTVTVRRWPESDVNSNEEVWRERLRSPRLRYEDADAIRAQLTIPARIAVESSRSTDAIGDNGRTATGVRVTGASPEVFPVRNLTIARGRAFTQQEAERGIPVLVLGKETAEVVFEDLDPIGRTVRLRGFPYRVIGVLEERGSILGQSLDNFAMAPARSPIQSITNPRGVIDEVIIQALDPDRVREIQLEVEGIMRSRRRLRPHQGEQLRCGDRRRRDQFLGQHLAHPLHRPAWPGGNLARGGRDRDHEHHAGLGHGADPRDRSAQGARSSAARHLGAGAHRSSHPVHRRCHLRGCHGTWDCDPHRRHFSAPGRREPEMDHRGGGPRHVRGHHGGRVSGHAGIETQPRRRAPL